MPTSVRRRRKPTQAELAELQRRGARPKKVIRTPDPGSLLVTRVQASRLLNTSVSTLIRLTDSNTGYG
jgi:hypothetical protein